MVTGSYDGVLHQLRRVLEPSALGDGALLDAFLARRDAGAFAALVRRHGPMVLGVCRRVLGNDADADDAFQATFLVLVHKATSVRPRALVGNWLYGVAHLTAVRAKARAAQRRVKEREAATMARAKTQPSTDDDVTRLVDEELRRLPDPYRAALVLCDLEGATRQEAARRLGWAPGTVARRLARGRALLRRRLLRRGVAGGVVAALAFPHAASALSPLLVQSTVRVALAVASGPAAAGAVSTQVAALTQGAMHAMLLTKLKLASALLILLGLLGWGTGALFLTAGAPDGAAQVRADQPAKAPRDPSPGKQQAPKEAKPDRLMLDKDVAYACWTRDGKLMATISSRREKVAGEDDRFDYYSTVKVWDAATAKELLSLGELKNHGVVMIDFSPDGSLLALGRTTSQRVRDGDRVELYEVTSGRLLRTIEMDYGRSPPRFAFSPDGKLLAVAYGGPSIKLTGGARIFEVDTGMHTQTIVGHKHLVLSVAFSHDGALLATLGDQHDREARVWDLKTGKQLHTIEGIQGAGLRIAFSPASTLLALADTQSGVMLWDIVKRQARPLAQNPTSAWTVTFSRKGDLVAASGPGPIDGKSSGEVYLWETATGQLVDSFTETMSSVGFLANDELAALGGDRTLRILWRRPTP